MAVRVALPNASALGASRLKRKAPFAGNDGVGAASLIGAASGKVREMVGELVLDGAGRGVVQRVFQDRAGNAGIFVVERNEWIPGYQGDIEGNGRVGQPDLGERKFTAEVALFKARKPLGAAASQTLSLETLIEYFERRGKRSFDELCNGRGPFDMENGERRFGGIGGKPFGKRGGLRTGADREILQSAGTVDADAACTEAADRHGHLRSSIAVESPLRAGLEEFGR